MRFYIVIPAHNEQDFIGHTLQSLVHQTLLPEKIVVVNDNSTDQTQQIVENFASEHHFISLLNYTSSHLHLPGSKVINAFYKGFDTLDNDYDIICKFDADLIFPENYLETISKCFTKDEKIGLASGLCYIKKNNKWIYEDIASKTHVRGPIKAYRKACFKDIGKLKSSIGWDTIDTLLAQYHHWNLKTIPHLKVKHLKPTGQSYNATAKYLQGEALYKMRYGFWLAIITALKLAYKKRSFLLFKDYMIGFFKAKSNQIPFLVSKQEGKFIRNLRWKGILDKLSF